MKTVEIKLIVALVGIAIAASTASFGTPPAEGKPGEGVPQKTAVTGNIDFSILLPSLSPYLFPGSDGDLYLRHLPLVGKFSLAGKGVGFDAKLHLDLNGELDATGSGVTWFQATLTTTIDGAKAIIFEGQGSANEVGLVATGNISLKGQGPYAGTNLEIAFQETGPGDNNIFTYQGFLAPVPNH